MQLLLFADDDDKTNITSPNLGIKAAQIEHHFSSSERKKLRLSATASQATCTWVRISDCCFQQPSAVFRVERRDNLQSRAMPVPSGEALRMLGGEAWRPTTNAGIKFSVIRSLANITQVYTKNTFFKVAFKTNSGTP